MPINPIAPTRSYLQAIKTIPNKTKEGIKCVSKGKITLQPLYSEKTSSENKDKKTMKQILKIRGIQ